MNLQKLGLLRTQYIQYEKLSAEKILNSYIDEQKIKTFDFNKIYLKKEYCGKFYNYFPNETVRFLRKNYPDIKFKIGTEKYINNTQSSYIEFDISQHIKNKYMHN